MTDRRLDCADIWLRASPCQATDMRLELAPAAQFLHASRKDGLKRATCSKPGMMKVSKGQSQSEIVADIRLLNS